MAKARRGGRKHARRPETVRDAGLPDDAGRGPASEPADLQGAREFGVRAMGAASRSQARGLVFDCFSGIAGDMTLAALIDAGASIDAIRAGLASLPIPAFTISTVPVTRGGLNAQHLELEISEERTFEPGEMRQVIRAGALPPRAEQRALAAIDALERAEARAHQTATPHFHEAGGVDAIIDLAGTMLALELLEVAECWCPVVTVGAGTIVKTEHGPIPAAPGPAAAYILQESGFALRFVESSHELVTPTGAAILAAVARPGPAILTLSAQGAGAGTFDPPARPNALRVFVGTSASGGSLTAGRERSVVELAANIDDMPATLLAHARDRMMEAGALDAWIEAIGMKKGRSASKLCVLVVPEEETRFAALILAETSTLGVRVTALRRHELPRRIEQFQSSLGTIRIKISNREGHSRASLEFEDVKAHADRLGRPAVDIQRLLEAEVGRHFNSPGDLPGVGQD